MPTNPSLVRAVPRVLLGAALLPGFACLITGVAQRSDVQDEYRIEFGKVGDTCNRYLGVHIDTATGDAVACRTGDFPAGAGVAFPGFTTEQTHEIVALSARLGADGLDEAEQRQVQARVDAIAATVPDDRHGYHYTGLWGTGLALTGAAVIAAALAAFVALRRRLEAMTARLLRRLPW
jgi:hypothetical protein